MAVASGAVPLALGTDTAGSLRIPAALCGISSFKPTYGLVPNQGSIPLAASFDHIGPMAREVSDCARVFMLMLSDSDRHRLGGRRSVPPEDLSGIRIGICEAPDRTGLLDEDVATGLVRASESLVELGAELVSFRFPADLLEGFADFMPLLCTDLWRYHRTLTNEPGKYQPDVAALVNAAAADHLDAERYAEAQRRRRRAIARWEEGMASANLNAVLEPTCPITAPLRASHGDVGNPAAVSLAALTALWDYTGSPVVALPSGVGPDSGLPTGVSLVGTCDTDLQVLDIGVALQTLMRPPTSPIALRVAASAW